MNVSAVHVVYSCQLFLWLQSFSKGCFSEHVVRSLALSRRPCESLVSAAPNNSIRQKANGCNRSDNNNGRINCYQTKRRLKQNRLKDFLSHFFLQYFSIARLRDHNNFTRNIYRWFSPFAFFNVDERVKEMTHFAHVVRPTHLWGGEAKENVSGRKMLYDASIIFVIAAAFES